MFKYNYCLIKSIIYHNYESFLVLLSRYSHKKRNVKHEIRTIFCFSILSCLLSSKLLYSSMNRDTGHPLYDPNGLLIDFCMLLMGYFLAFLSILNGYFNFSNANHFSISTIVAGIVINLFILMTDMLYFKQILNTSLIIVLYGFGNCMTFYIPLFDRVAELFNRTDHTIKMSEWSLSIIRIIYYIFFGFDKQEIFEIDIGYLKRKSYLRLFLVFLGFFTNLYLVSIHFSKIKENLALSVTFISFVIVLYKTLIIPRIIKLVTIDKLCNFLNELKEIHINNDYLYFTECLFINCHDFLNDDVIHYIEVERCYCSNTNSISAKSFTKNKKDINNIYKKEINFNCLNDEVENVKKEGGRSLFVRGYFCKQCFLTLCCALRYNRLFIVNEERFENHANLILNSKNTNNETRTLRADEPFANSTPRSDYIELVSDSELSEVNNYEIQNLSICPMECQPINVEGKLSQQLSVFPISQYSAKKSEIHDLRLIKIIQDVEFDKNFFYLYSITSIIRTRDKITTHFNSIFFDTSSPNLIYFRVYLIKLSVQFFENNITYQCDILDSFNCEVSFFHFTFHMPIDSNYNILIEHINDAKSIFKFFRCIVVIGFIPKNKLLHAYEFSVYERILSIIFWTCYSMISFLLLFRMCVYFQTDILGLNRIICIK